MSVPGSASKHDWHAFTLAGVPARFSPWFAVIGLLVLARAGTALGGLVDLALVTGAVLVHELGRAWPARRYRLAPKELLHGAGGWCEHDEPHTRREHLHVVAGGPVAGLALSAEACRSSLSKGPPPPRSTARQSPGAAPCAAEASEGPLTGGPRRSGTVPPMRCGWCHRLPQSIRQVANQRVLGPRGGDHLAAEAPVVLDAQLEHVEPGRGGTIALSHGLHATQMPTGSASGGGTNAGQGAGWLSSCALPCTSGGLSAILQPPHTIRSTTPVQRVRTSRLVSNAALGDPFRSYRGAAPHFHAMWQSGEEIREITLVFCRRSRHEGGSMIATGVETTTPFRLFEGETVLKSGRADRRLLPKRQVETTLLSVCAVVLIPLLPLAWWIVGRAVGQHRWWLTDRRLVVANGVIGRTVRSVPLDRIVDVTLSSTWWDRVWGLEHVTVRDMTGEVGGPHGATGLTLLAVDDADRVADSIQRALPQATRDVDLVAALRQLLAA